MQHILAKSNPPQSLFDHLTQVRSRALETLTPARCAAFARLGVSSSRAEELISGAAWLHDWGKATREWQDDINAGKKRLPQHSLTSFLACRWALNQKHDAMPPDLMAMSLAVLAHHGQMHKGSYDANSDIFRRAQVSPVLDVWRELARDLPFTSIPAGLKTPFDAARICTMVSEVKSALPDIARKMSFRGLFCLLLSSLVQADHAASGNYSIKNQEFFGPQVARDWTPFQSEVENHAADILCAMAGCGAGKTAAALLRAAHLADAHNVERIVLCLPTRFTSNSLLRDMANPDKYAYPEGMIGLVHSEALLVLKERHESEETDFPDTPEERASRAVRYEHPITISTVDHLLMSLYHGYKYADRAFGNLLTSLVVFDEIHAYDATTLSAIRDGVRVLEAHGVPVLLMSATLPQSRRRFLGARDEKTVIENANIFRPFVTRQMSEPLTSGRSPQTKVGDSARQLLRESSGLKLAIYVNQVERAKTLAKATREEWPKNSRVYCYHSELAPRDRVALEREIIEAFAQDEPICLVTTQAAELSLDISSERMISELASADVVVQRAGRLNRRGLSSQLESATSRLPQGFTFELFLAPLWNDGAEEKEQKGSALPYDDLRVLERTWSNAPWNEVFTFERGLQWCEIALPDEPIYGDGGLREAAVQDSAFGKKPQENFSGDNRDGVTIRDIDEDTRAVIPEVLYSENFDVDVPKTPQEMAQFRVPLRRRKFHAMSKMIVPETIKVVVGKGTKRQETFDHTIHILKDIVPYNAKNGGFDFSVLSDENVAHEESGAFL